MGGSATSVVGASSTGAGGAGIGSSMGAGGGGVGSRGTSATGSGTTTG